MRMVVAATALGMTLIAAAALAACSPQDPISPPGPDPSHTPVFSSDEEALAAAEELYGRYLEAANEVAGAGWKDPSALAEFARGDALASELDTASDFSSKGYRQVGDSTFDSISLQQLSDRGVGLAVVTVYLCVDVSSVDVVNSAGDSVVVSGRPDRLALEVDVDDADGTFKISRNEPWSGNDFC